MTSEEYFITHYVKVNGKKIVLRNHEKKFLGKIKQAIKDKKTLILKK